MRIPWTALLLLAAPLACVNLDAFVFNPVHCTSVGPATCEEKEGDWNDLCATCDEPYPWDKDFDWIPGTLEEGDSVRPIPPEVVVPVSIPTADGEGTLDAYFIPAHGEDAAAARVTILYSHGNFGSIEHYLPRIRFLYEGGYNLFVWDYRGYGKSMPAAVPTGAQLEADALTVREVAASYAPDPSRIAVYGYSLGAIPSVDMGREAPGCALILECPFTSLSAIAEAGAGVSLPGGFLSDGLFENDDEIKDYPGPLLVMAGTADQLIPIEDTQVLFDAAPGPKELWILDGVGHGIGGGGVPEAGMRTWLARVAAFLDEEGAACRGR